MKLQIRGFELTYPRILFGTVLLITVIGIGIGLVTSSAAYGPYNHDWDGTSDLRTLAGGAGADVEIVGLSIEYQEANAEKATAFILEPSEPYSDSETQEIESFLNRGGTVVVASGSGGSANHLLTELDIESRFDGYRLRDEQRYYRSPAFPVAAPTQDTWVTENVSQLTLNHGTAVTPSDDGLVLINSSEFSYLDVNANHQLDEDEPIREHPVVVQEDVESGSVIIVSDLSVFINGMLERTDNHQFAKNIVTGSETVLFDIQDEDAVPSVIAFSMIAVGSPYMLILFAVIFVLLALVNH